MSDTVTAALIGALGASLGTLVAFATYVLGCLERRSLQRNQLVLQMLENFSGGTQKRNVGIAIVEGYWYTAQHLRPIFVPLLTNQAIYLLSKEVSEHKERQDPFLFQQTERNNLNRIMALLVTLPPNKQPSAEHITNLLHVLNHRKHESESGGLFVETQVLAKWIEDLKRIVGKASPHLIVRPQGENTRASSEI